MFAQAEPDPNGDDGVAGRVVRLDGRQAFTAALRGLLLGLNDRGVNEIWMVDQAYLGWPLDEPAVLASLKTWFGRAGRRANLIGHDFESVARFHPRFADWRRDYAHCLAAFGPEPSLGSELGALLLIGGQAVELLDRERWQARLVSEPALVRAAVERVEALLRRCEAAWPIRPLGL